MSEMEERDPDPRRVGCVELCRRALSVVLWPTFLLSAAVLFWFLSLPWPLSLRWRDPETTSFMEYRLREAREAGEELEVRNVWAPLTEISPHVQRAVLLSEDDRFYLHRGIDWKALAEETRYQGDTAFSWFDGGDRRALWASMKHAWAHRGEIRGRSTLTQQLAKNLYFTPRRSLFRKVNEVVVAKRLEWFLSKERILELYLNVAEWGPGVFGVEAAARTYFGQGAAALGLPQATALAATLPHPLTSNPTYRPGRMEWRRDLLLQRMYEERDSLPMEPPAVEVPRLEVVDTLRDSG